LKDKANPLAGEEESIGQWEMPGLHNYLPGQTLSVGKKFSSSTSFRIYRTPPFSKNVPDKPFSFNLTPSYVSFNINHQNCEIRTNSSHISKKTQDIKCHLEIHMPY